MTEDVLSDFIVKTRLKLSTIILQFATHDVISADAMPGKRRCANLLKYDVMVFRDS